MTKTRILSSFASVLAFVATAGALGPDLRAGSSLHSSDAGAVQTSATVLPGVVQVEDFDGGGPGVSYYDQSSGNAGGAYRDTDVDIEPTTDQGGGYDVGWVGAGEWLAYTVALDSPGNYSIDIRVACPRSGGTFHIEVNGSDKTGPVAVPNTGDWQTWTTVALRAIPLASGIQILRLVMDRDADSTGAVGNFNWIRVISEPTGGSSPYKGAPASLPGLVQVEDFDNGGESVSYHDASKGNAGGAYRESDVDIETTADSDSGYNVGWVGAGEWLAYTVDVTKAGKYTIELRVASAGPGGTFHVESNGVDKTGPITVPNTGGWQDWTIIRPTVVALSGGIQVLRLVADTSATTTSAVGNFDWIRLTLDSREPSPYGGSPAPLPGTLQAEDYDRGGEGVSYHDTSAGNSGAAYREDDVDLETTSGGGINVGWVTPGEWLNYTVAVAASGSYSVALRVAAPGIGGTFHIEINGNDVSGPVPVPATGDWQAWTTVIPPSVTLAAGTQVLRVVMDAAGSTGSVGNFDWIRVQPAELPPNPFAIRSPSPGSVLRASRVTFRWDEGGEDHMLAVGSTPGGADVYTSAWLGPQTELSVWPLPLNGQTLYVRLSRRVGGELQFVDVQYTAAIRRGLLVITDFADRVLEDWTGSGMRTVDDVSLQLRKMEDHWRWLSRDRERFRWDIVRVQLPRAVQGAFSSWIDFRTAVATLAKQQIDVADYDVNGDGIVDAAWFIVSSGDQPAEYAIGGASQNAGVGVFVDGQASGSVIAQATGNFNHELGHLLGLPDMYGTYGTMSSLTVMGYSWPVPPPDFSAYERMKMGWLKPRTIRETTFGVWLPSANETFTAVLVPTRIESEYFLIEYRKRPDSGYGSQDVRFDGLAVYHVYEGRSMWQFPPILKLEPADGAIVPSQPTDPYDFLSPENPHMILPMYLSSYYGAPYVFRIENVVRSDGGIAFDIIMAGGQHP